MSREPFASAIYKSDDDASLKPVGNFTDHVNSVVAQAKAARTKNTRRKQYGSYSSPAAQGTPESRRLTRRITAEKDD